MRGIPVATRAVRRVGVFFLLLISAAIPLHSADSTNPATSRSNGRLYPGFDCAEQRYTLFPGDQVQIMCYRSHDLLDSYPVRVGDRILLRFPSLPDYSLEQPVKPDGTINLPRMATFRIGGLTLDEAQRRIAAEYEKMGWHPEFILVIIEAESDLVSLQRYLTGWQYQVKRQITVGPDGYAIFPLVGRVPAVGRTLEGLSASVQELYRERFDARLHVDLVLSETKGNRVFIYGAVSEPGGYEGAQSLPQIMAMAQPRPLAKLSQVVVMRVRADSVICKKVNYRRLRSGRLRDPDVLLCPGTIVYVPENFITTMAEFTSALSRVLFFRGFTATLRFVLAGEE